MSRSTRRTFVFEISSMDTCEEYKRKIRSAVGDDLVEIDRRKMRVVVSTYEHRESVRLALEKKTRRSVRFSYEDDHRRGHRHGHREGYTPDSYSRMKITIKYERRDAVVNAPSSGKGAHHTSSSHKKLRSYHRHNLYFTKGERSAYKCSGCKELGIGDRYKCNHCSYILHRDCRYYEERATHEFLVRSRFKFHQSRFDNKERSCDACGSDILGFSYHCEKTDKDLHPCCLNLPRKVNVGDMKFSLRRRLTSNCLYCYSKNEYKDDYWCYSLRSDESQAHVSCMKHALIDCMRGERKNDMSTTINVKRRQQLAGQGLKWAQILFKVAIAVLSGNPFPLLDVVVNIFQ